MVYAKLINGCPCYAPGCILWRGCWVINPHVEKLRELGYKPLIFIAPQPAPEGFGWVEGWEETEEDIRQSWQLTALPTEGDLSPAEALEILMGGNAQ